MAATLESMVRVEERFVEPEKPVDREKVWLVPKSKIWCRIE